MSKDFIIHVVCFCCGFQTGNSPCVSRNASDVNLSTAAPSENTAVNGTPTAGSIKMLFSDKTRL